MKPLAPILGLALALAGCSQFDQAFAPPPPSALSQPIQAAEIDWSRKSGANTVSGIATMKAGETTHTCGGQAANLVPDSAYARARMTAIFGNDTRGTRASAQGPVKFDRDDPLYVSTLRRTTCDASGSFSCQSAFKRDPGSASKRDPPEGRVLTSAHPPSELFGRLTIRAAAGSVGM